MSKLWRDRKSPNDFPHAHRKIENRMMASPQPEHAEIPLPLYSQIWLKNCPLHHGAKSSDHHGLLSNGHHTDLINFLLRNQALKSIHIPCLGVRIDGCIYPQESAPIGFVGINAKVLWGGSPLILPKFDGFTITNLPMNSTIKNSLALNETCPSTQSPAPLFIIQKICVRIIKTLQKSGTKGVWMLK